MNIQSQLAVSSLATLVLGQAPLEDSNLVDSASSHTLVSKIKPCMSKYKYFYFETANGSLYKF